MSDWREIELGDFLTFQRGFDIVKRDMKEDGLYNVIFSSGFGGKHTEFKVKAPGVIVGRKGTLGSVFYSDTDFWPTDTTLWIKDFHGNNPKFAYYFLPTLRFEQYDCGSANPTLNRNHIHTIEIRIPTSLGEQANIAAILSSLDRKISNLRQQNETLEAIAQTLFKHWFVDFEFPNEDGKPYKSAGGEMGRSELGEIPVGWRFGTFRDITTVINGRAYKQTEFREEGTPIVRIQNLTGKGQTVYSDFTLDENKYISKGDLIYAWSATFGAYIWRGVKSIYHYHIWKLNCFNPAFKYYLYIHLKKVSERMQGQGTGSIFTHITKELMESQELSIPEEKVVERWHSVATPIFDKIMMNYEQVKTLTQTRDVLLPKLMSGQLRITEL